MFGATLAPDSVSLTVSPGEIVGLIGPNGAGKTSFMDAVTGFARLSGGAVSLDQLEITRWPAYRRAPAGLVRSFQSLELYPDMTVAENVRTAVDRHLPGSDARGRPPISRTQAIRRSSARPRLSSRRPP